MSSALGKAAAALPCLALAAALSRAPLAADAPPAVPGPAPRIAVEPDGFDFGAVRPDRSVDKEFVLRNFGDAPLEIESVTTSCGCAVAKGWSKTIAPGSTTPLRVTLRLGRTPGPLAKSVLVKSNDPARPRLEVMLRATVVAPASPAPPR